MNLLRKRSFAGETIVVIGGGNVAIDIARTALRLGPKAVHLYCLEKRDEMPAHKWEIEEAECEGIIIHDGLGPTLIAGEGKVERIDFRKCVSVFNDQCVFSPAFDESVTTSQQADRVLVAIGRESHLDFLGGASVNLASDAASMRTSLDGVFAAGEVVSGPASVIQAIADGRRAASGIDRYLGGDGNIDISLLDATPLDLELSGIENFADLPRNVAPRISHEQAVSCMALVESGYSADTQLFKKLSDAFDATFASPCIPFLFHPRRGSSSILRMRVNCRKPRACISYSTRTRLSMRSRA